MPIYNFGRNILLVYCVTFEVCFATSKTGLDLCFNKPCIPLASRVPEQLKT